MNSDDQLMTPNRAACDLDHTSVAVLQDLLLLRAQVPSLSKGGHPHAVCIKPEERGIKAGNKKFSPREGFEEISGQASDLLALNTPPYGKVNNDS